MRIVRFVDEAGEIILGEEKDDGSAVALDGTMLGGLQRTSRRHRIAKRLAPLVPSEIICIGRNYRPSSAEVAPDTARQTDNTLEVFLKPLTALQHPDEPIFIPQFGDLNAQLDCEGELAVVIGRAARDVREHDALDHIMGYTIGNDATARLFQTPTGPPLWMRGKGFDAFCPLGPVMVTADEIGDARDLSIRTNINGRVVREGCTRDMIRNVRETIAALSRHMTLPSGAVILTGAPPSRDPAQSLRPGDQVVVEIEGIGSLSNVIASAPASLSSA